MLTLRNPEFQKTKLNSQLNYLFGHVIFVVDSNIMNLVLKKKVTTSTKRWLIETPKG